MRRKVYEDDLSGPVEPMSKKEEDEITALLPEDWTWYRNRKGGQKVDGVYGYWFHSQPRAEGCTLECFNSPRAIKQTLREMEQERSDATFMQGFTAGIIRRFA